MNCGEVRLQLTAYLNDELDIVESQQINQHLNGCEKCRALMEEQQRLDTVLSMRRKFEPPYSMYANLQENLQKHHSKRFGILYGFRKVAVQFAMLVIVAAATLIVDRLFLTGRMMPAKPDVAINLYLFKHREATIHLASFEAEPDDSSFRVRQDDILYYEKLKKDADVFESESGLILKGKDSKHKTKNIARRFHGKSISLDEIRESLDFEPIVPLKLYPGYILLDIKNIQEKQCVQLIYTDGIHTLSLFQQPVSGKNGLFPQDFREYALYKSAKGNDTTILAWREPQLMYVMVGNRDMSLLMNLAKSIQGISQNFFSF